MPALWLVVGLLPVAGTVLHAQSTPGGASAPGASAPDDRAGTSDLTKRAELEAQLQAAVDRLIAEAEQLDNFKDPDPRPVFERRRIEDDSRRAAQRGHPALREFEADMGPLVLDRMLRPFTGNEYRDTYIRWHLIIAVQMMLKDAFEESQRLGGDHTLPPGTGTKIMQLIRDMPGPLQRERRPDHRYEPPELAAEYHRLHASTAVTVGYPPFQQTYHGRAALPYVSGQRKAQIEAALARMEQLRGKFRSVVDREARAYNHRVQQMNMVIRQYRGDLIYALIQTGEDELLRQVVEEIGRQLRDEQFVAFDLLRYMYLAVFDGYLKRYRIETLRALGEQLEGIARGADTYKVYKFGDKPVPSWVRPRERNFADYAFHMVQLLQDPGVVMQFRENFRLQRSLVEGIPDKPDVAFKPYNFTLEDVRHAIDRAVRRLHEPSWDRGGDRDPLHLLPTYDLSGDRFYRLRGLGHDSRDRQAIVHEVGNQAVVSWAMLAAGESYQDPRLFKRVNWVLSSDAPFTFDRGMRLQMLANLPYSRWGAWVRRDAILLTEALSPETGNFPYQYTGEPFRGWGDHANGQYGVLGLWAAQEAGFDIPLAAWRLIDAHWRKTQQQTPPGQPAGWAVGMFNVDANAPVAARGAEQFYSRVSGPMTAAGVATLTLTERYLYGPKRTDPDEPAVSRELQKGLAWLDQNFTLDASDPFTDWYYYMWTIQRVGQATGYRIFNGIDWFRQVTAEMLNRQHGRQAGAKEGLWEDPAGKQSELVSTAFALLYLGNSYAPIAISKIRFDGEWNSRPHDIWNFVDFASDLYEVKTTWQIVDLEQPVYQLIESPILYLASGQNFRLSDAQIQRLREYIDAGGLLVTNPDTSDPGLARSIRDLASALFPDKQLTRVENDHPIYTVHQPLRPSVQMQMIDNGIRPLMVHFIRDIGEGLQANDIGRSESFTALSNLYLYSVGMQPKRARLQTNYVVKEADRRPVLSLKAARIQHGGAYDPEPGAMQQLQAILWNDHGINLTVETVPPSQLSDHQVAFLTTVGQATLTDNEAAALRRWVEGGGTLWIDATGGSKTAIDGAQAMLNQVMPNQPPTRLGSLSPVISGEGLKDGYNNRRVHYRFYALRSMGAVSEPLVQVVRLGDRPAVYFSAHDITCGLAGLEHWGIYGYDVDSARHLVINSILNLLEQPG